MNRRGLLPFEQSRKDRCAFYSHGLELVGVESQGGENGGSNLGGFHRAGDRPGVKSGVRYENPHVGVVVREPTMLGLLLSARRVNYAHVRLDDDIRRSRIALRREAGRVEHCGQRGAIRFVSSATIWPMPASTN